MQQDFDAPLRQNLLGKPSEALGHFRQNAEPSLLIVNDETALPMDGMVGNLKGSETMR